MVQQNINIRNTHTHSDVILHLCIRLWWTQSVFVAARMMFTIAIDRFATDSVQISTSIVTDRVLNDSVTLSVAQKKCKPKQTI